MIDRSFLERINGIGGATLLGKMIDLFLTNAPQRLAAAREGEQRGDLKAVEQAVHSLKSSSGNLGAMGLMELAGRIEELAEQRRAEEIPLLLDELEELWEQVKVLLETEKKGLES